MAQTEDEELVKALLAKRVEISAIIPAETQAGELEKTFRACGSALGVLDKRTRAIKYAIAQGMVYAAKNPSLWSGKFRDFEAFAQKFVYRPDFERAIAWQYKRIVEKWPTIPFQELAKIPTRNMLRICGVTQAGEPSAQKYLEAAASMTLKDLDAHLAKKGHSKDDTSGASFEVKGSLGRIRDIRRFLANEEVHKITGSADPATNLIAAIGEFTGSHPVPDVSFVTLSGTPEQTAALQKALASAENPIAAVLAALGAQSKAA